VDTATDLIEKLGLSPLSQEGGYFAEKYRSGETIQAPSQAGKDPGSRSLYTAIYYLLTPDTKSALHRLRSDEIFHFYFGDPVEQLQLYPDGTSRLITLGPNPLAGETPQLLVPAGVWQGSRLAPGGSFALMGTTVVPGFEFVDYEHGALNALLSEYPDRASLVRELL
jgi:predicted cupin superfamily sugar epimerase